MLSGLKEILNDMNLAINKFIAKDHLIYCDCEYCKEYKRIKSQIDGLYLDEDDIIKHYNSDF
jgi:hypothetical protein